MGNRSQPKKKNGPEPESAPETAIKLDPKQDLKVVLFGQAKVGKSSFALQCT